MNHPRLLLTLSSLGISLFAASCEHRDYDRSYSHDHRGTRTVVSGQYRPGYYVQTLPSRYETVNYGGYRYYVRDNVYYRPQGRGYVVVENPRTRVTARYRGTTGDINVIRALPRGYRTVSHRGVRYYQYGDAYYQPVSGGYQVVASPYSNRRWR